MGRYTDLDRHISTEGPYKRVGDKISTWEPVLSGVPQGSVLGPLLFVLFINDLPDITKSNTMLFADDAQIIGNARAPEVIQSDINLLSQLANTWQMSFNPSKCSVVHIGRNNRNSHYLMAESPLRRSESERDLGIIVSAGESLCWEEQIRTMIGKARQTTAWIVRNVISRKPEVLIPLYKAFVRRHLEYGVQVWAPTARHGNWGTISDIEKCQ